MENIPQTVDIILSAMRAEGSEENRKGMARFGINTENAFGVSMPFTRSFIKAHKKNHALALALWDTKYHEARILACLIEDPKVLTEAQMDAWVNEFSSWDLCDQCCSNLFSKSEFALKKVHEWARREEEFVKRAAFALIAALAVHAKKEKDEVFIALFQLIERAAYDERNFVKKAVNWALRQIGKRNLRLNEEAINCAENILQQNTKSAKWIASDALRELKKPELRERLLTKDKNYLLKKI